MLASLNYKLHLYFKSHYAKSTTTSDLMSLNMASNFRNNELALFVFSPHIILQICKRSAKQIVLHLKKNYISLIFISSYIFSQILPRSGYVTTTTAAVQEFTEKDKSVTKRVSTSWLFLTFYKKRRRRSIDTHDRGEFFSGGPKAKNWTTRVRVIHVLLLLIGMGRVMALVVYIPLQFHPCQLLFVIVL